MDTKKIPTMTDEEIARIRRQSAQDDATGPRALSVRYKPTTRSIELAMRGGVTMTVPLDTLRGFDGATEKELANVVLYGNGSEIHWPALDEAIELSVLIPRALGLVSGSDNARKAGAVRPPAQAKASAANGAKGGRRTTGHEC